MNLKLNIESFLTIFVSQITVILSALGALGFS